MGVLFNVTIELVSIWMIVGTIAINTVGFTPLTRWLTIGIGLLWIGIVYQSLWRQWIKNRSFPAVRVSWIDGLIIIVALVGGVWTMAHRTLESIRSPWWVLPLGWLIIPLTLVVIGTRLRNRLSRGIALSALITLLSTLLVSIYALGYGYDIHIHSAALRIIQEGGQIFPRTPYYMGFYALTLIIHTILPWISISLIQQWFPPLVAAFVFSVSLMQLSKQSKLMSMLFILFLFPIGWISESTPQALAFTFALASGMMIAFDAPIRLRVVAMLATGSIHLLSGIPLFVTIAYHFMVQRKFRWAPRIIIILGAFIVPALFSILTNRAGHPLIWSIPALPFALPIAREFNPWLDSAFTIYWNRWILVLLFLIVSIRNTLHQRRGWCSPSEWSLLAGALSALLGALILRGFQSFPNVIAYETTDYPERLLQTAMVLALPALLPRLTEGFDLLRSTARGSIRWMSAPLLIAVFGISLYTLYPIDVDGYHVDKGYSMSIHDLRAVEWIHDDAGNGDYIVLANQSVSAAAIERYGFQTYYNLLNSTTNTIEPVFYYPVPTGGLLYPFYLTFVYEAPHRTTVIDALQRVEAHRAYVVINRYWKNSSNLIYSAQQDADTTHTIDDGAIWIFRYDRSDGLTTE